MSFECGTCEKVVDNNTSALCRVCCNITHFCATCSRTCAMCQRKSCLEHIKTTVDDVFVCVVCDAGIKAIVPRDISSVGVAHLPQQTDIYPGPRMMVDQCVKCHAKFPHHWSLRKCMTCPKHNVYCIDCLAMCSACGEVACHNHFASAKSICFECCKKPEHQTVDLPTPKFCDSCDVTIDTITNSCRCRINHFGAQPICCDCWKKIEAREDAKTAEVNKTFDLQGFLVFLATPAKYDSEIVFKLDPPIKWDPLWVKLFNDANFKMHYDKESTALVALSKPQKCRGCSHRD